MAVLLGADGLTLFCLERRAAVSFSTAGGRLHLSSWRLSPSQQLEAVNFSTAGGRLLLNGWRPSPLERLVAVSS